VDQDTFNVQWTASDQGGSGVRDFDVQYQADGGPWQDWVTDTTTTAREFSGEFGHNYGFRVRSTDNVGNEAPYPAAAQIYVVVIESSQFVSTLYVPRVLGTTDPGTPPRGF
jgi:hypothetical protein